MDKYTSSLLLAGLMSSSIGLYVSNEKPVSIKKQSHLALMNSLDHGKMWPKQKAQMRHHYLNAMQKQIASFPFAQNKQERLANIKSRIKVVEQQINGKNYE